MDCSPFNLAHFHERRSERFLRNNRYDEAIKSLQTSLIYLQDVSKNVTMKESREILDSQKWEIDRKLRQVEIRKKQHNQHKMEEIDPLKKNSPMLPRSEPSGSPAQGAAATFDKTVKDFEIRFPKKLVKNKSEVNSGGNKKKLKRRESIAPGTLYVEPENQMTKSEPQVTQPITIVGCENINDDAEFALAPLDLPTFDMTMFTSSSAPSLENFTRMMENLPN